MSYDKEKLKDISIVGYLAQRGVHPKRTAGKTAQYLSPLGEESDPSFMVDVNKNTFWDYSTEQGGDIFSLVKALEGCNFHQACMKLGGDDYTEIEVHAKPKQMRSGIEIVAIEPLTNAELIDYMTQERKIEYDVVIKYCECVSFKFPYSKKDPNRIYTGVGFKNDMGGYEIRNSWQRVATTPKCFTTIKGSKEKEGECLLFEAWIDFLTYLTVHNITVPKLRAYVLNGTGMVRALKPFLEGKTVYTYTDSDRAGDSVIKSLDESKVVDMRHMFMFYNDYNEYLQNL